MIIDMGRKIIHPAGDINELPVGKALAHFFDTSDEYNQDEVHFFNGFAIQCNHQVQYAMSRQDAVVLH